MHTEIGPDAAMRVWTEYIYNNYRIRIPVTMPCNRTFARDEIEALYVNFMARFIQNATTLQVSIRKLPLFAILDSFMSRWWHTVFF